MARLEIRCTDKFLERLDAMRGSVTRSDFVRTAVEKLIGVEVEPSPTDTHTGPVAVAPGKPEVPNIPGLVAASTLAEPTEGRCRHDKYRIVRNWGRICEDCEMSSRDEGKTWQA